MKQTLAQKLVARAAGRSTVTPGEIVTCKVDLAMVHDSSGPRRLKPMLERLGAKVWDPSKVVVITDHYLPEYDDESRKILRIARDWVREAGVDNFYDAQGICHVVLPERGHLRPGMFAVGGDSHSPTGGAFAAYMFGVGATEMLGVMVTGEIWLKVPHTIAIEFDGAFAPGVSAKDAMLFLIGRYGMDGGQYQAVEYRGPAIRELPMQERMTLCNMTAELGGQTGLVASDDVTRDYLQRDVEIWDSDADAPLLAHHRFRADELPPQVRYCSVCSSLPGLKRTALPGGMETSAPVRGLRPIPVLRGFTENTPKPRNSIRSLAFRASFMQLKMVSTACSAFVLLTPVRSTI